MKKIAFTLILGVLTLTTNAQDLTTKSGFISFYSETEDITAENFSVTTKLTPSTGEIIFSAAIQSFKFENATMQKHFNAEDVMSSAEFPKAKFKGMITNNDQVDYTTDGEYDIIVSGSLTIKGTTNQVETKGKIKIVNGKIFANATFTIDRFEYGIKSKKKGVSQMLELTVKAQYE